MKSRMKSVLYTGIVLGTVIIAGCSPQADADSSEEAASVEWTEAQIAGTETDLEKTKKRISKVEKDLRELKGEPSFSEEPVFPDVDKNYHAFEEIQYLSGKGIIGGYPNGNFQPGDTISRAQTAKMLTAALDLTAPADYVMKASDVSVDHHAYKQLAALEYNGLMTGKDGKLMPAAGLKRSQMATLLVRAFELPNAERTHSFTDITESYPNFEQINIIADQGITSESGKAFRPNETTSRAQFSLFMSRAMEEYFRSK
ncbi:S-layer homology domain-containing protein [Bacillus piscicola]|uniref:S-layer homology domain-containing protein n=1 Tax=Bacillus piscicola TaxID=1632684 RepID=UPI001F08B684|nr:S-layer homology domain-containing protein [Bacillus piscicola]